MAIALNIMDHYDMPKKRIEEITAKCTVVSSKEAALVKLVLTFV